jgi:hypothetical protein
MAVLVLCLVHSAGAGLVGHWKLDETTGTQALDSSGHNFHGMYEGGATLGQPGADGFAVGLDGTNDRVRLPALKLNSNTVSMSAWVWRRGDPGIYAGVFVSRAGNTTAGISTGSTLDAGGWGVNNLLAYNWNDDQAGWSFNSGLLIPEQEWTFVAVVIEPDKATLYMDDGELRSAVNPIAHRIEEFDGIAYIGYDPYEESRYWPGRIDDVRVYNRALSEAQIQGLLAGTEPTWFKAMRPDPADGAAAVMVPLFRWSPGDDAGAHNIYLGTSPDLKAEQLVADHHNNTTYYHMSPLQPGVRYFWRVDEVGKDGATIYTGDVWSFIMRDVVAYHPDPPDGAVDAQVTTELTWLPALMADQHHVYFGTSLEAVTQGATDVDKGLLTETTFDPCGLESTMSYFWRVDELLATGAIKTGPVWSFTTCLPVDDFESYNDDEGKGTRIYETWVDGYSDSSSGSTVGNIEPPFAEQTIVRGGKQSMPMDYNNVNTPFYSEAYREFSPLQDWTVSDVNLLTIWVRGKAKNSPGPLYVTLQDASNHAARVPGPDAAPVTTTKWTRWQIPLNQFAGVNLAKVKRMYIGVGDRGAPAAGGTGRLYIDDIYVTKP